MASFIEDLNHIFINSQNRIDKNDSVEDFSIKVDNEIPPSHNRIVLNNISIIKSYYLINKKNNRFIFTEDDVDYEVILDIGNYNVTTLIEEIQKKIDLINTTDDYIITLIRKLAKLQITRDVSTTSVNNKIKIPNKNLQRILGMVEVNQFINDELITKNLIHLQKTSGIKIYLSNITNNDKILRDLVTIGQDNDSIIFNEFNIEFNAKKFDNSSNILVIRILDSETDELLDLNGVDFHMSLITYKHNNIFDIEINKLRNELKDELKVLEEEFQELEIQKNRFINN